MTADRNELLLRRVSDIVRSADYLCLQRDSLLYECMRSKIPPEEISERTGLAVHYINRHVHDYAVRLEEAS